MFLIYKDLIKMVSFYVLYDNIKILGKLDGKF